MSDRKPPFTRTLLIFFLCLVFGFIFIKIPGAVDWLRNFIADVSGAMVTGGVGAVFRIIIFLVSLFVGIPAVIFIYRSIKTKDSPLLLNSVFQLLLCAGVMMTLVEKLVPLSLVLMPLGFLGLVIFGRKVKTPIIIPLSNGKAKTDAQEPEAGKQNRG